MAESPRLASSPNHPDDEVLDESYFSSRAASSRGASIALEGDADPLEAFEAALADPPSPAPSSTTSSAVDSLAGAPHADIEARALEFLSASPPATAPDAGFGWKDMPLRVRGQGPVPAEGGDAHEAQARAVDFLRKMLDEAERDEWMHDTPGVFASPRGVGGTGGDGSRLARRADEGFEAVDGLDAVAQTTSWQDRAFNVERWHVDGLPVSGAVFDDFAAGGGDAFEAAGGDSARFNDSEVGMFG